MEVAIAPSLPADEGAPPPIADSRPDPHHLCPQCPYSSPYKANVVRHIKLVHDQEETNNGEERSHKGLPQLEDDDEIISE